jgi:adsorption protein B
VFTENVFLEFAAAVDRVVLWCLAPLAVAILISGLDDLVIDVTWGAAWLWRKLRPAASLFPPGHRQLDSAPRRRIAILVPLWHEHAVIARMLQHAVTSIRYPDYHIIAGTYPNDEPTQAAVRSVEEKFSNVHLVLCPHDGPTSKADCLNWIYQHLGLYEEKQGQRFEIVVIHDAEDILHPDELRWINFYSARYDFVQTPVLALQTPFAAFTHGIYCDEFAEYHTRDMVARPLLGGFIPSCGVGTGYRRDALEKLAIASSNCIFEPGALTEDYQNGLKLFRLGCSQAFVPISILPPENAVCATREYFPQTWGAALRQRTRWVMGIALQGWQQYGWRGKPGEVYWLWRDRKGLIANPLSVAANAVFIYGVATQLWTRVTPSAAKLAAATLSLQFLRMGVRMACVARIYGFGFALGVPLRNVYANALNASATARAIGIYTAARVRGRALKWVKTEHAFPSRAILLADKRRLGEVLVSLGYLTEPALRASLVEKTASVRLGDHLIATGLATEHAIYEALGLQQNLPFDRLDVNQIPPRVARVLPEHVVRDWQVLPFKISEGSLHLAGPEIPSTRLQETLKNFTALHLNFHLVTPTEFEKLAAALL